MFVVVHARQRSVRVAVDVRVHPTRVPVTGPANVTLQQNKRVTPTPTDAVGCAEQTLTLQATSPFLSRTQWALESQGLKVNAAHDFLAEQPDVWLPRKPGLQPPHLYEP